MSRSRRRGRQTPLSIVVIALLLALCPGAVAQDPDSSPSITSPPEINGVPRVGETLWATPGEWRPDSPNTTPSYQWFRCAPAATCGPIEGATTRSYRVIPADEEHTLFIRLTVDHNGRQATADSDATSLVPRAPTNITPPEVSGTARTGQLLTASPGAWIGTPPLEFTYQWERCGPSGLGCEAIAGAASASYVVTTADADLTLRLAVIAANAGGTSAPAYSVPTGVVERGKLVNLIPPSTTGTPEVGRSLTATPGLWNDDGPIDFLYRWLRCRADGSACAPIPQGTDPTYRVSTLDVDHRLRVRVTAINDEGSAVAESALTTSVQGAGGNAPRPTLMSPFPVVRVSGIYTRWGAVFRRVSVRAPRGATITIDCRGPGCPYRRRARIVRIVRLRSLERAFRAGARLEIRVTKPGVVGKYARVRIRARRPPARQDRCVMPGSRRPVRCPSDVSRG